MKQTFILLFILAFIAFQFETSEAQSLQREKSRPTDDITSLVDVQAGERATLALPRQTQDELTEILMQKESYFNKLRYELNKLNQKSAKLAETRGVALNSAIHLAPTKMAFHVIDGALLSLEAWKRSDSSPMKMVDHINSTFDTTAWFSFYVFSASQGYYINFKSKDLSPELKARAMRQLMYKGMVIGSLFSTLTADVIHLFQECHSKRMDGKSNIMDIDKACDQALKMWTSRNLLNKFGPQILNLIANQIASDLTEAAVKKVATSKVVMKATENLLSQVEKFFLVYGFDVAITVTPGGLAVRSVKTLLTLMQFSNFLIWDHILQPVMYRLGGNITFSWSAIVDLGSIENLSNWFSTQRWDFENLRARSDQRVSNFPESVMDFTQFMNDWRFHLNQKNEEDLSAWMTIQQNLIHQVNYLNQAYRKISDIVYDGSKADRYPFISLPLYGVDPGYNEKEKPHYNQYILNLKALQIDQMTKLSKVVLEFENSYKSNRNLNTQDVIFIKLLITELKTNDMNRISKALIDLNNVLDIYGPNQIKKSYRPNFFTKDLLGRFRKEIGDPRPIMNPGIAFSYAFNALDTNATLANQAHFPLIVKQNGVRLNFENPMAYVMYNAVCGPEQATIFDNWTNGKSIVIPRITNQDNAEYCQSLESFGLKNLPQFAWYGVDTTTLFNSNISSQSVIQYITDPQNLIKEFHGKDSKENAFAIWWERHEKSYLKEFKKLDDLLSPLLTRTSENYSDIKHINMSKLDSITKFSASLPKTIKESLIFEMKILIKMYKNYLIRNQSQYSALGKDFIKNIKNEVEQNNSQFVYQRNQALLDYSKSLRKMILKKYNSSFVEMNHVIKPMKEFSFKEKSLILNSIKERLEGAENGDTAEVEKMTESLLKIGAKASNQNSLQDMTTQYRNMEAEFLKDDDNSILKTLMLLSRMKLFVQHKLESSTNEKQKDTFSKQHFELDSIQAEMTNKFKFEIFESLTLDLIELFQSSKELITVDEINSRLSRAQMYLALSFDDIKELSSYQKSKSLDKRFQYAIYEGLNSVVQSAARYSNLMISMEDKKKIEADDLKKLQESTKLKASQTKYQNGTGHRAGSYKKDE